MDPIVGQVTLGVFAALLAVGGTLGYVKARSRPSLFAGFTSAILAIGCDLLIASHPALGLGLGALLAALLVALFSARYAKSRKFMPSGMMGAVSVVVLAILVVVAIQVKN
ncbi:MAG TPA: TMEM14 family protein [Isosphaeraceae bacterium]|jgi:uncharacterized membrane protein (UPF0136 family)|nr:TMEM14 family protein [Isosphaeraceae bacterium]